MSGYWNRLSAQRVSRRNALKAGAAGLGDLDEQTSYTNYRITSQFNGFLFHINAKTQEVMLQMADITST